MIYEIDSPILIGYSLRVNLVYVLIRASFNHHRHLKSSVVRQLDHSGPPPQKKFFLASPHIKKKQLLE